MRDSNSNLGKLALGTVAFGLPYGISNNNGQVSRQEVASILSLSIVRGVTLLDTAAMYGESESVLGELLEQSNSFDFVSKLAPGTISDNIEAELRGSLRRLKRERLYGYLLHSFLDLERNPELWAALSRVKGALVEKIGVSVYHPREVEWILEKAIAIDIIQLPFSLLDRRFHYLLPELKSRGVEIHARSVFLQGLLFMEPESLAEFFAPFAASLKLLREAAEQSRTTVQALALQFVASQPDIDRVILGITSRTELEENLAAVSCNNCDLSYLPKLPAVSDTLLNPANWPRS